MQGGQSVSERVDGVYHELDLGVLFVAALLAQLQHGRAQGDVAVGRLADLGVDIVRHDAAEHFFPEILEPKVPLVVVRRQRQHVIIESRNDVGL